MFSNCSSKKEEWIIEDSLELAGGEWRRGGGGEVVTFSTHTGNACKLKGTLSRQGLKCHIL